MNYKLIFVFAGMVWVGLSFLLLATFAGLKCLVTPKPKPTDWEKQWQDIERRLNG